MTSEELSNYFQEFITECQDRILGVGAVQYDQGDTQKFETMTRSQLIREMQDELRDVAVYAVMNTYRLEKMRERVEEAEGWVPVGGCEAGSNVKTSPENFLDPKVTLDGRYVTPDGEVFDDIEEYDDYVNLLEVRF